MSTATNDSRIVEIDPQNAPGNLDELENSLRSAVADGPTSDDKNKAADDSQKGEDEKPTKPEWIEDKFWTGDLNESAVKQAQSYRELHSAYGRMANDLGTQRKMTDRLLALDKRSADLDGDGPAPKKRELPKIDPRKLVDNPNEALDSYLEERDRAQREKWEEEQRQVQMQQQEQEFTTKYPDYQQTAQNDEFKQWVWSSPLRHKAAVLAAQGDFGAAGALMDEWAVAQNPENLTVDENNSSAGDDVDGARQASTESAAQAGGSGGVNSKSSNRVYRRADLIKLRMERPEQYSDPAFQAEIMAAYAEGRVK